MRERRYAYLDLAALPPVGAALLSPRPSLLYSADATRLLWANAAGAAFFGEADMAAVAERRFSPSLPATEQIARFARSTPLETPRLERIRFLAAGRLGIEAATCRRIALADGESAVLVLLEPRPGLPRSTAERARSLARLLAAPECSVAVLDAQGRSLAASEDFDDSVPDAAAETLIAALRQNGEALIKRAIRVDGLRRSSALLRFEAEGETAHLWIVGPPERVDWEEVVAAPLRAEPAAELPPPPAPQADAPPVAEHPVPPAEAEPELPEPAEPPDAAPLADAMADDAAGDDATEPAAAPIGETAQRESEDHEAAEAPAAEAVEDPAVPDPAPDESPPDPVADIASETAPIGAEDFVFVPPTGPLRFVFQMDAEGRFSLVSPEFAATVGPQSADIVGALWHDVATARGLDRDGAIAALIRRRDTWSGVTLDWPVDRSEAHVAVDLAALPAFSRDRRFEGYRGFGVIRPADRRREPSPPRPPVPAAASPSQPAPAAPAPAAAETPAPTNVVRLPRAGSAVDGERLSMPEQDAFRRIAAALGARTADEIAAPVLTEEHAPEAAAPPAVEPDTQPEPAAPPGHAAPSELAAPPETSSVDAPQPAPEADAGLLREAVQKIAELETILDTATDGVVVLNAQGRIDSINRTAEALFGIESAAVHGLQFVDLLADESRKSATDYLDSLAQNGVASVLNDGREVIGRVPQGGLIPLFMTMGRLGETGKFCAVLRDITHWKNAEEELVNARRAAEQASMQKSDFLAKISHEIRTPLNAIIGFSEVMMEERFGPIGTERYKEYLRDIHVSGAHLMSLLNDLLDLSKIEAGKLDLAFEAVPLNDVVLECVALMQPQANRERIIIRTSLSPQVTRVVADSRSIRQIMLNLLSNAVKFTQAGGQVIVSTTLEAEGEVTLKIRDTGVGMSERDIETALKPFRQLTTSPKGRNDGTGLGLPLTKALVEANRAAFIIDSAVGQGTLIRITFPTTRVLA